jgi:plasmid maintenance system antidote protein VapI
MSESEINVAKKNNILELLTERKMTRTELATIIGTDESHLSKIINNVYKNVTVQTASKIAKAFGVTIEEVFPCQ